MEDLLIVGFKVPPGMGPMVSPQQAMFMQQGPRGPFPGQGPGVGLLQGPLAYLEKTTSNIGMSDGRR
ncbi:Mediator of RNA polymerase II transcription subunit 28 [Homalodisca vitripennis]|nr:Mediator of RNA polymerase II transcription subunit 28 [Homalodisca vitripennis]